MSQQNEKRYEPIHTHTHTRSICYKHVTQIIIWPLCTSNDAEESALRILYASIRRARLSEVNKRWCAFCLPSCSVSFSFLLIQWQNIKRCETVRSCIPSLWFPLLSPIRPISIVRSLCIKCTILYVYVYAIVCYVFFVVVFGFMVVFPFLRVPFHIDVYLPHHLSLLVYFLSLQLVHFTFILFLFTVHLAICFDYNVIHTDEALYCP